MGHGKETPRQKMIGMMYLVLTAMLALNVSKEVLDAFINVNDGLNVTTANFTSKVEGLYSKMDFAYSQNADKAEEWKEKADEVNTLSDELYNFINECKVEIVSVKDGDAIIEGEVDLHEVDSKDNTDTPAEIMIVGKKGEELKAMIDDYRERMIEMIDNEKGNFDALIESIEGNLDTHDHPSEKAGEPDHSWESHNFEHLPLAAVITILSKMQADVRNVESDVVNYLLGQVDAKDFKVNKLRAVVLPNSNYVFRGQEYRAEVFLAAYDSTKVPTITVDGQELPVEGGSGIYTATSSSIGERTWGGVLILDNDGEEIRREFSESYTVAETNAVISPTKMNVFYRGVDNPVSISASGVPEDAIRARISAGRISPSGSGWVVRPGPRETSSTVKVYANVDGRESFMGEMPFRVMNLPDPTAMVDGLPKGSGVLSLGQLTRLQEVKAEAEGFLFEVQYEVTGFQVNVMGSGGVNLIEESNTNTFTSAQKQIFQRMRPGQRVVIENITAIGPDGVKRSLNSINIKIQ